jgi:hypothetical protein
VFDDDAMIVLIVLDSLAQLEHYRAQPVHKALYDFFRPASPQEPTGAQKPGALDLTVKDKRVTLVSFNIEMPTDAASPHADTLLFHGRKVDASSIDDQARIAIAERMRELGRSASALAAAAGPDVLDANAITQVLFLDSVDTARDDREKTTSVAGTELSTVPFTLVLSKPPW